MGRTFHSRSNRGRHVQPPKAPPPATGYLMVFPMSPVNGQYTQTNGKIEPICQAIGENVLDPFWEDIKSVDWYNIEPIRTAMQRNSAILCG
jgi:hypothetical protein